MPRAYEGVKILDFTQVVSGPMSTYQLALLGAEVIKVEPPGKGDMCRALLDTGGFGKGQFSPMFIGVNLNKRSITVNLKHPDAMAVLRPLVLEADVIAENFRPGVLERLGFGYEAMREIRPDIIYCSVSGYGQQGPRRGDAAFDGAVQAASGLMASNGHEETGPTRTVSPVVDVTSGLMAAFAIGAALHRRQSCGEGQYIDVAMLDSAVTLLNPVFNIYLATQSEPSLVGNRSFTQVPTADTFPTRDGMIQITAITEEQAETLCREIGLAELLADPRFSSNAARIENRDTMRGLITQALSHNSTDFWYVRLAAAGVPTAPVASLPDVMENPQLAHRNLTATLPAHDSMPVDTVQSITTGYITDVDGPSAETWAPALGEHTDAILAQYGFSPVEIDAFRASGVLGN